MGRAARRGTLVSCALAAVGAIAASSAAGAPPSRAHAEGRRQASVSSNWAGYLAVPSTSVGSRFSSVSGSWRQPSAACSAGRETFSAIWVGLGGDSERARSLEQIGTDADCSHSGSAVYSSWYELLPAAPVSLALNVQAGDQMSASVTVRGRHVTLRIRDLSTGARFTVTRRAAHVDVSSAEWIIEAPSACASAHTCQTLPLTDFGDLVFSSATATARSRTGPIADADWAATALELQQSADTGTAGRAGTRAGPTRTLIRATPSSTSHPAGAFSVSWREQSIQIEQPNAPTLPGSGSGPA
jgi:hypothetical protein